MASPFSWFAERRLSVAIRAGNCIGHERSRHIQRRLVRWHNATNSAQQRPGSVRAFTRDDKRALLTQLAVKETSSAIQMTCPKPSDETYHAPPRHQETDCESWHSEAAEHAAILKKQGTSIRWLFQVLYAR